MSSEIEWRWADPRGQQRLVRTDELRAALANGVIAPNAPVWRRGWNEWKPAHEVPELQSSALSAANGVVPNIPPPPLFVVAAQSQYEGPPASRLASEHPPPPPMYTPAAVKSGPSPVAAAPEAKPTMSKKKTIMGIAPAAAGSHGPHSSGSDQLRRAVANVPNPPPSSTIVQAQRVALPSDSGDEEVNTIVDANPLLHLHDPDKTRPERRPASLGSTVGRTSAVPAASPSPAAVQPAPVAPMAASPQPPPRSRRPRRPDRRRSPARPPWSACRRSKIRAPPSRRRPRARRPPPRRARSLRPRRPPSRRRIARAARDDRSGRGGRDRGTQRPARGPASGGAGRPRRGARHRGAPVGAPPRTSNPPPVRIQAPPAPNPRTPIAKSKGASTPPPPVADKVKVTKRQTLILGEDGPPQARDSAAAPPIVVPGPGAQVGKNAVTRPPPWGEGAVAFGMDIPKNAPAPAGFSEEEEVSGSLLVEDGEDGPAAVHRLAPGPAPAPAAAPQAAAPHVPSLTPPPPAPVAASAPPPAPLWPSVPAPPSSGLGIPIAVDSGTELDEGASPPYPWMGPLFARFPALRRIQQGKPKAFLPVVGALGVLSVFLVVGVAGKACFGSKDADTEVASEDDESGKVGAKGAASAKALGVADPTRPSSAGAMASGPCRVVGEPKAISDRVVVPSGVEVARTARGIALGFATAPRDGVVVVLDPTTLGEVTRVKAKAADTIKRVMPIPTERGVNIAVDTDRKNDRIAGRRTSAGGSPIDIGVADEQLVGAPHNSDRTTRLWALAGDDPAEALRAVPIDTAERGLAIAFRREGAIWLGGLDANSAVKGPLVNTPGMGEQVGSPALAASGDMVLVVWADRADSADPWILRQQRWRMGEPAENAKPFEPPSGGLGAPYMSPGVAGIGGGRFLVVWTEGPVSSHQVRAVTVDSRGNQEGEPLSISTDDANAGQGQAAVGADGRGVVAYLVAEGGSFSLMATPVVCPPP